MSFQNKDIWMGKGPSDADPAYENQLRNDPKRPHQWFTDPNEELLPNKKQVVETPPNPDILTSNSALLWENPSSCPQVPSQLMDRLFGSEDNRPFNMTEHNVFPVGTLSDDLNITSKDINEQYGNDLSVGLSVSHAMVDPETCLNYGGIRRVKVNQVKDSDSSENSLFQAYNTENETNFLPVGHSYNKEDANTLSFGDYNGESHIDPLAPQPLNCEPFYDQSATQTSEITNKRGRPPGAAKAKCEALLKAKGGVQREAPNSFPSNVKSLISTGMFDGVPVKYVSLSREAHRGIIKGNGYLCGCKECNFSKALNAFRFESHAGCKTKHPNNHIYFESGKTVYQIVQELKTTSESELFDAIQTITGSPINQKAFRTWKESYQAATRELQRIYGKGGLN